MYSTEKCAKTNGKNSNRVVSDGQTGLRPFPVPNSVQQHETRGPNQTGHPFQARLDHTQDAIRLNFDKPLGTTFHVGQRVPAPSGPYFSRS